MENRRRKLIYCTTIMASFARNDVALLEREYRVMPFVFAPRSKWMTPLTLLAQFIFLLRHLPGASVSVSQFGGFHSFLPALLGRMFRTPAVIVLGGFDCASFPSFRYGAHHRFPMGWMTRASLRWAKQLVPCSTNLVLSDQHYSSAPGDPVQQGYKAFDPKNSTACSVLAYGYDPERFKPIGERQPGSFLTVAQMNGPNFQRKGVDLMFTMAERFPECRFTLVGNTHEMRYARVPANVDLIGFVPYEELPSIYARHVFYLQLSIWEGFPSAPCEAMLCGCIPIVSRVAALPEITGDTGFILEKRDGALLEALIHEALTSDVNERSRRARQRIMERFPLNLREELLTIVRQAGEA